MAGGIGLQFVMSETHEQFWESASIELLIEMVERRRIIVHCRLVEIKLLIDVMNVRGLEPMEVGF